MPVDKQQIDKQEREMVQIELYAENLDAYADMFVNALNFTLIEKNLTGGNCGIPPIST